MFLAAATQSIGTVAVGTAVGGAGVGFLLGWNVRAWWTAESDEQTAAARHKGAKKAMWASRKSMIWACLVLWATALAYIYGQGR